MNYKKQILMSILFALVIAILSYFIFTYLPFDCGDLSQLSEPQQLECRTKAFLGIYYWLPYTTTLFFFSILFYWLVFGIISIGKYIFRKS